jgi:hypothetical protein
MIAADDFATYCHPLSIERGQVRKYFADIKNREILGVRQYFELDL